MRLGKNQLRLLVVLGSPTTSLVVPGPEARSMVKNGLLKTGDGGGFACITPNGLRALAEEMEAGRVDDAVTAILKDVEARKAAIAAKR